MENRSLFSRILGHKLREDRDLSNAEMSKVLKVSKDTTIDFLNIRIVY